MGDDKPDDLDFKMRRMIIPPDLHYREEVEEKRMAQRMMFEAERTEQAILLRKIDLLNQQNDKAMIEIKDLQNKNAQLTQDLATSQFELGKRDGLIMQLNARIVELENANSFKKALGDL